MKKKDYNLTPWYFEGKTIEENSAFFEGYFGFIYELTNTANGKKYIGRKDFVTGERVKGSKVGKGYSDWLYYTGSNDRLNADVKHDISLLRREILVLCESRKMVDYKEVQMLFANDVIMQPASYYNDNIAGRWYRSAYKDLKAFNESHQESFKIDSNRLLES